MTPGSLNDRPAPHAGTTPTGGTEYQMDVHTEADLVTPVGTVSFRTDEADIAAVLAWRLLAAYPGPADRFGELYQRNQQDRALGDYLATVDLVDLPGALEDLRPEHAGPLDAADRQQLLAMATDYVRLRAAVVRAMTDPADWDIPALADLARLRQCLDNMATARHGTCGLCRRPVRAAQPFAVLPARSWWHPLRWLGRRSRLAHLRCCLDPGGLR